MADNTVMPIPTTSGDVIAADDISGVKFQRVKMTLGGDGVDDGDVSSANPLPVSVGSIALASGASTAALQTTGNTSLGAIDTKLGAPLPLPTGAATDLSLVAVQDLTDSVNTLVQFLYANAPRRDVANRMAVNGSEVTQPVSGTVAVSTVTTVSAVTTLSNITSFSGQPVQYVGQGVPIHVYNNIKVT